MLDNSDDEKLRMLIVLAAASGMRLGEILGLSVNNVSEDRTVLTVVEKAYRNEIQDFLKTNNGKRLVDDLRTFLHDFVASFPRVQIQAGTSL